MMDSMEYSFDSPQGGSVQEILRNLPPESAEILTAYYLGGKSQAEIAHLNGIPLGTVKSRLFHAKKDSALHVRPKSSGSMKKETS